MIQVDSSTVAGLQQWARKEADAQREIAERLEECADKMQELSDGYHSAMGSIQGNMYLVEAYHAREKELVDTVLRSLARRFHATRGANTSNDPEFRVTIPIHLLEKVAQYVESYDSDCMHANDYPVDKAGKSPSVGKPSTDGSNGKAD